MLFLRHDYELEYFCNLRQLMPEWLISDAWATSSWYVSIGSISWTIGMWRSYLAGRVRLRKSLSARVAKSALPAVTQLGTIRLVPSWSTQSLRTRAGMTEVISVAGGTECHETHLLVLLVEFVLARFWETATAGVTDSRGRVFCFLGRFVPTGGSCRSHSLTIVWSYCRFMRVSQSKFAYSVFADQWMGLFCIQWLLDYMHVIAMLGFFAIARLGEADGVALGERSWSPQEYGEGTLITSNATAPSKRDLLGRMEERRDVVDEICSIYRKEYKSRKLSKAFAKSCVVTIMLMCRGLVWVTIAGNGGRVVEFAAKSSSFSWRGKHCSRCS